ncbi:hypothetical protein FXB40_00845 [Bradyrhizobium rifense]|uniref:Uncharacterized protein n=1 Tax=Bradyrhizobium rifense TaxID=515499 RepID=A0A5D3L1E0_9BRAD|nr:hypothetical protein FXB40_00845 [Bradyrhizobium rifense]
MLGASVDGAAVTTGFAAPPAPVPDEDVAAEPPAPAEEAAPPAPRPAELPAPPPLPPPPPPLWAKVTQGATIAKTSATLEILMAQLLQRPSHAPAFRP